MASDNTYSQKLPEEAGATRSALSREVGGGPLGVNLCTS